MCVYHADVLGKIESAMNLLLGDTLDYLESAQTFFPGKQFSDSFILNFHK